MCKSLLRKKMIEYFKGKQSSHFGSSKKFWNFYKAVVKTKKSNDSQLIPNIVDSNNISHTLPTDIANIFNYHFTNLSTNSSICDNDAIKYVDDFFNHRKSSGFLKTGTFSFINFSTEKILEAIDFLDTSSACGVMQIPTVVIKNSAKTLAPVLASLFNQILKQSEIPADFKCALVFPLFKKGRSLELR